MFDTAERVTPGGCRHSRVSLGNGSGVAKDNHARPLRRDTPNWTGGALPDHDSDPAYRHRHHPSRNRRRVMNVRSSPAWGSGAEGAARLDVYAWSPGAGLATAAAYTTACSAKVARSPLHADRRRVWTVANVAGLPSSGCSSDRTGLRLPRATRYAWIAHPENGDARGMQQVQMLP